ncbi:MAG: ATP-binding protein [Microcystis aeruginosa LL13-03]|nr:ATP-binding protein [Microcystis aeruginosa SX13-11]NCR17150.1 ATP-binding protein [Microcystis aeruginosa LL13-03]NCR43682.1 ATP-binding protein [Microcystis aeruginosa SX13-01]NCR65618.1 ATP-binding protein [Microcystis aeruginosa LL11-07]NCR88876.1 ATP-binding protein [Microcystis aeruginosa G13-10]NCS14573.1 ATP-binding protein [Microcystis aeruginosa G13-12]NCS19083.1 ATP-binding protein [Microcystis aeruginosa G11-06]NCS32858.1 ATP-binding protein [Microcystis aeruginosa G11-01]NCT
MLQEIHLKNVSPASEIDLDCASRLNILTGDNGLGKTFLLDIIWWCINNKQGQNPVSSYHKRNRTIEIEPHISDRNNSLNIYCRVDGGFSIYVPYKQKAFKLSSTEVWYGRKVKNKIISYGLLEDWIKWQNQPNQSNIKLLAEIIQKLSAKNEQIKIGEPTRMSLDDIRVIPTIELPYETIPVTEASAGIQRILSLAYMLVWMQSENLITAQLFGRIPARQLIFLMDETEAHLHPRWQRSILPAILTVLKELEPIIDIQLFITTHSPLVLASVEPLFDQERDKLFLFELNDNQVTLNEITWAKQGDVIGWLTSEVFGLKQARSQEAEQAIEAAQAWMRKDDMTQFPENLRTKEKIHQQLLKLLPGHDPFFPRWIVRMEADD